VPTSKNRFLFAALRQITLRSFSEEGFYKISARRGADFICLAASFTYK
jgi:hypothetical protein